MLMKDDDIVLNAVDCTSEDLSLRCQNLELRSVMRVRLQHLSCSFPSL
jgi:hypothetical protein